MAIYRTRLKARLTVLLAALVITEVSALVFSLAATLTTGGISPVAFDLFSAATLLLAQRWVRLDARRAFGTAVRKRYVILAGTPPRIIRVSPTFPGRWLALLHIRLHPELVEDKGAEPVR
ncbi:hypothetical protein PQQ65_33410 [Paraburkholderia strydomiana]|uniref:hypothetical protein n=1 Tax=Paraburkholderia strydomiana TaxID=1245417 RepID=UPI0038B95E45